MNVRRFFFIVPLLGTLGCVFDQEAETPFGTAGPRPAAEGTGSDTGSDSGAVAADAVVAVCERIDACGFLPPGVRAADCEDSTRMCLEGALQSELSDWELVAGSCLQFENCFNFLDCYEGLSACEVDLDGGTSGSSSGDSLLDETTGGPVEVTTTMGGPIEGDDESSTSAASASEGTSGGPVTEPPLCEGTCNECIDCAIDDPCNPEANACALNLDCLDLADCYGTCDDSSCYDVCETLYPGGIADYDAFAACALDVCGGSC